MDAITTSPQKTRYGFYYYPDTLHYSENDLHTWMPEMKALGASWLPLLAPTGRAIPESFIRQLIEDGIQPVLHLPLPTTISGRSDELNILFNAYAHWGVNHLTLFDRPNMLKNCSHSGWANTNRVDRVRE